ncbi:DUF4190 domain-containing protein [Mycolicibacterium fluoranthenivorans]|uniref:DUF4190 domain-containing protein n=1 Tax=Mycolicibacterium fluoranthenivorans TaxID=258505 RepID=A0A7X5ZFT2_9MYCO|nr:DUF4190 domain-containing protein [Mycolicibacterium fluoranthenivorans]MCV7357598.1 DUF4190 domain-containing protein [Mycolicibacterium fluoranthenivorans]NIH98515.1 hypothetical protein [Mycolicibacterium fluoranthenivorans]
MTTPPPDPYRPPDPFTPVDYPTDPGLPPPVYPGPYPPPGYPQAGPYPYPGPYPGYDPYRQKPTGTNGKAIAALIISLGGLVFCGLPSVAGLILGVVAMRETRRTGQDGWGLALAGAIIGGLATAGLVFYMLLWIGFIASGFSLV